MSARLYKQLCTTFIAAMVACGGIAQAQDTKAKTDAQSEKPNIVFIMGDDIGMWNIGAYSRGMMAGRTPNIDKLASEGAIHRLLC